MQHLVPLAITCVFVVPWAVVVWKMLHVMTYEWRAGIYTGVSVFSFDRRWQLRDQRQSMDAHYDRLRTGLRRWYIITGLAWVAMIVALFTFAVFAA